MLSNQKCIPSKTDDGQMFVAILKEFCSESTVHGVRYFAEQKRHWVERVWWVVALILSTILCTYAVFSIWTKWNERPVLVSFNDKTTSVAVIPFPAITICPTKKFSTDKINIGYFSELVMTMRRNETIDHLNLSNDEFDQLDVLQQLCFRKKLLNPIRMSRNESFLKTIEFLSPPGVFDMNSIRFLHQSKGFKPFFTGEGLCYTFNALNSHEIFSNEITPELTTIKDNPVAKWTRDNGYAPISNESAVYPLRVFGAGTRDTFSMFLSCCVDGSHKNCSSIVHGFQLLLHMPDELPRLPDDFIRISVDQEMKIAVKPNVIVTSDGLRRYATGSRGCFFGSERKLRFFQSYNQRNCELECLANYTHRECGCVKFAMPRDSVTKVCTMLEFNCSYDADVRFSLEFIVDSCQCMPDCTSITFDVEISQAQRVLFDSSTPRNATGFVAHTDVSISFKLPYFIMMNRTETYTMFDFIASCGGLLGLFMGISMLSVIELIYYLTLRLFCTMKKHESIKITPIAWEKT